MSVAVEDFLDHHGVKGQHWGIQNIHYFKKVKNAVGNNKKLKVGLEIGAGVAAAGTIAAGAVFTHKLLLQNQAVKATELTTLWRKGKPWIVTSPVMKTPVSSLPTGMGKADLKAINLKGLKKLKGLADKTLKPGSSVKTSDVGSALANVAKSGVQDTKSTKRSDVVKLLKSVRIGVGPA